MYLIAFFCLAGLSLLLLGLCRTAAAPEFDEDWSRFQGSDRLTDGLHSLASATSSEVEVEVRELRSSSYRD